MMKAALYEGKGKLRIIDIPKPTPQKGEVLVKVKYTGICGSDLEAYKTGLYPAHVVLGHEITGTVAEVGPEVKKWKEGDRTTIDSTNECGKCYFCQKQLTSLCFYGSAIGIDKNGGFAEFVSVPERCLVPLPDSIPDKYGTVFDQIATDVYALRLANFQVGSTAVVLGLGPIGQFLLQCLQLSGVRNLVVIDKNTNRLEIAKKFNPDLALSKVSLPQVKRSTKHIVVGSDFVFECTGVPVLINAALNMVRKGGCIVQIGLMDKPLELDYLNIVLNQIRIQGVYAYLRADFEFAVELVARKLIDPQPIVTKIISLDDIVEEGFNRVLDPETKDIKILVEP